MGLDSAAVGTRRQEVKIWYDELDEDLAVSSGKRWHEWSALQCDEQDRTVREAMTRLVEVLEAE